MASAGGGERLLDWHQSSREQGLAVVSALVGPPEAGAALFRSWLRGRGRGCVEADDDPIEASVARAYYAGLASYVALGERVVEVAAAALGEDPERLDARLPRVGHAELSALFESLAPRWPAGTRALGEALLAQRSGRGAAKAPPSFHLLCAAARLSSPESWPGLLLRGSGRRLQEATETLLSAARVPGVPLAITVAPREVRGAVLQPPDLRWKAVLREGLIPIEEGSADAPPRGGWCQTGPSQADETRRWQGAPRTVAECIEIHEQRKRRRDAASGDGSSDWRRGVFDSSHLNELHRRARDLLARAARDEASADEARSAAERLLFARLEAEEETAGRFELNGKLDVKFGPAQAEIDLLCRSLRVAVEVDGYHHFRDDAAFRRDRRKDVLLQKQGFFVLRCLAQDVVEQLDDVVADVLDAIRFRRDPRFGETDA